MQYMPRHKIQCNKVYLSLFRINDLVIDPFYNEFYEDQRQEEDFTSKMTSSTARFHKPIISERKSTTQCYSFLLIKLIPANSTIGMRMYVPDTIVYTKGEPAFIAYNAKVNFGFNKGQIYEIY